MPCDLMRNRGQTPEQRQLEIEEALANLQQQLAAGNVTVEIGPNGAIVFQGWADDERNGVTDVCAYQQLKVQSSFELQNAIALAEMQSGRKVNEQAIAAGYHSHDGGATWSTH